MTCGEQVVVKAISKPKATNARKTPSSALDDATSEIAAMQVLQRRRPLGWYLLMAVAEMTKLRGSCSSWRSSSSSNKQTLEDGLDSLLVDPNSQLSVLLRFRSTTH